MTDDKVRRILAEIEEKLIDWPDSRSFSLVDLLGEEFWQRLYIGDKVKAGNLFLRRVRQGTYAGVKVLPVKDNFHRTLYIKSRL
ncbi:DUF1413 domain-containing protein [Oenococcus alcoholitolerans]|uniref:DUF1413 domain-containing protein n=1 Tax=Oenococcus alcoholitolerans TaxID=931074 RepID=UPI003F70CDE7